MLEALCAWYLYKRVRSLLLAVTIYWVAIGWILDLVIYVAWVGLTREYVVLLLVKQQVNGSSPAEDALVKDCTTSTYKLMRLSRIPHGGICANNVQTVGPISRLISTFPVSPPHWRPRAGTGAGPHTSTPLKRRSPKNIWWRCSVEWRGRVNDVVHCPSGLWASRCA